MTAIYKHKQIGWVTIIAIGLPLMALLTFGTWLGLTGRFQSLGLVSVPAILLAFTLFFFSSLTVEVTNVSVNWYFGAQFWWNELPLSQVVEATAVGTHWYWGYGIKYFGPGRWLYNVSGEKAVELTTGSDGWVRIGTDDPQGLLDALQRVGVARHVKTD